MLNLLQYFSYTEVLLTYFKEELKAVFNFQIAALM